MIVELVERSLDQFRKNRRLFGDRHALFFRLGFLFLAPFFGEFIAHMLIQVAQYRHIQLLCIVALRHERDFHQPRFDSFDQPEVAYHPGKQRVGLVTGSLQVVGGGRQVIHLLQLEAFGYFHESGKPDSCFCVLVRFFVILCPARRFWQVTVVGLVVEHEQAAPFPEASEQAIDQPAKILFGFLLLSRGIELAVERAFLVALKGFRLQGMVVRDHQACIEPIESELELPGYKIPKCVIIGALLTTCTVLINEQHAKTLTNGNAWGDNQEIISKPCILSVFAPVEEMVEHQHPHDNGLSGSCRHLECEAWQLLFLFSTDRTMSGLQNAHDVLTRVAFFRHLVQPDSSLYCFTLSEK